MRPWAELINVEQGPLYVWFSSPTLQDVNYLDRIQMRFRGVPTCNNIYLCAHQNATMGAPSDLKAWYAGPLATIHVLLMNLVCWTLQVPVVATYEENSFEGYRCDRKWTQYIYEWRHPHEFHLRFISRIQDLDDVYKFSLDFICHHQVIHLHHTFVGEIKSLVLVHLYFLLKASLNNNKFVFKGPNRGSEVDNWIF